ncbi:polysaccharide biosynthesis tyrosine autokinase [unidentified bacterial endosymbiont]|uniref:polysaccharide biosynthesis tyrosine autokinase n=1 Tax=unidentified bacterial endosymbiont TaxID=2355 RepID=UPI0020A159AC|nr:polysaccharide biosynthesis tyrosine autokinase [unidentified bacterial endosymbiont]
MLSKNDYAQNDSTDPQQIDLFRMLLELFEYRMCILLVTVCFTIGGGMYAFLATPVYTADALVQIEDKQQNSLLKSLSQFTPSFTPDSTAEIQLLKSRMILGKTVQDLNLQYEIVQSRLPVVGKIWARINNESPGVLKLAWLHFPSTYVGERSLTIITEDNDRFRVEGKGISAKGVRGQLLTAAGVSLRVSELDAPPGTRFTVTLLSLPHAINALHARFSVKDMGKESGILSLSMTGFDPVLLTRILNSIAENYLQQNIARQAAQDSQSLDFLQRQLPKVRSELDNAEQRLNDYRRQRDSVDLTLEAKSVLEQIVNVDNQLNEITFREAEISQYYKKEHPTYRALREKRQTLEDERARLNKRVSGMPSVQQEILRLSRDVDSGRAIYQQLLTRQQELNISRSSTIGNVRIIDAALTQPDPVQPRKALIVLLSTLIGFILSATLVLLKVSLKRGIDSPDQLESQGLNVYATLPRSVWLNERTRLSRVNFFSSAEKHRTTNVPFLPVDRPLDNFVEAVRGLRTSLHFAMMDAENNILMFSGPTQNCGKTLVSTTLAALVAQVGERVLLIDADMRKGYIHNIFSLSNDAGLSDVLSGKVAFSAAVQTYSEASFDVVTCGMAPPNPSELLMHDRFRQFMEWASERYDMVIIDTPPILAVTDAAVIGHIAASTLLVARHNVTSVKEMLVSVRRLQKSKVEVKGVVVNDFVNSAIDYYSNGYKVYGYGYEPDLPNAKKAR